MYKTKSHWKNTRRCQYFQFFTLPFFPGAIFPITMLHTPHSMYADVWCFWATYGRLNSLDKGNEVNGTTKHLSDIPMPRLDDDWWWYGHFCAQGRLNGRASSEGDETKRKTKQPSDMPTPGGSDLWSNTLPLDHGSAPMPRLELRCLRSMANYVTS